MAPRKKATVYLDARLHRALRLRARATDCTISEVIGDALRQLLAQEAKTIQVRPAKPGPAMSLASVGARLKRRPRR
jgi:hypothetical protein